MKRINDPELDHLLQSKPMVLGILFGVTGVLGLPLLWVNRRFSKRERIVWSILTTLWTAALIAVAVAVCVWAYRRVVAP